LIIVSSLLILVIPSPEDSYLSQIKVKIQDVANATIKGARDKAPVAKKAIVRKMQDVKKTIVDKAPIVKKSIINKIGNVKKAIVSKIKDMKKAAAERREKAKSDKLEKRKKTDLDRLARKKKALAREDSRKNKKTKIALPKAKGAQSKVEKKTSADKVSRKDKEIAFEKGREARLEGSKKFSLLKRIEERKSVLEKKGSASLTPEEEADKVESIMRRLKQQRQTVEQKEPLAARVFKVKRVSYENTLPVTGDVKSSKEIKMRFEKEGVITEIKVREGDIVERREVIATIDKKDATLAVARARSKLDADKAALGATEKDLALTKILYEKGAYAKLKFEEAQLRVESERAKVKVSEKELEMAESAFRKTDLRAPVRGIVGSKEAEEGELVTPREVVVNLLGLENIYADVGIVERDIHRVSIGQEAVIRVDAYPNNDFMGEVGNLYPVVEKTSRMMKAEIDIVDDKKILLPGMFAQADILLASFDDAVMVPTMSLRQLAPDMIVAPFVVLDQDMSDDQIKRGESGGMISFIEVETGYVGPDYTQIISGLKEGDIIVLEAHGEIEDGGRVRILGMEEYGVE